MKAPLTYQEIKPIKQLSDLVHSFWMHKNISDVDENMTIVPDSFLKIIFVVKDGKIQKYFMTGLWINEKKIVTPANTINYGCRLKILAPEYLLQQEVASILQKAKDLDMSYLNLENFDLSSFERIVNQWQMELMKIKSTKEISENKQRLSDYLDKVKGIATAKEIAEEIFWTNRQINRYLNKYIGVSLKKYLNIQRAYYSYIQIREGRFFPEHYYDRAHFVREIKKHTGMTPTDLYKLQNDRFIQIKNIQE